MVLLVCRHTVFGRDQWCGDRKCVGPVQIVEASAHMDHETLKSFQLPGACPEEEVSWTLTSPSAAPQASKPPLSQCAVA